MRPTGRRAKKKRNVKRIAVNLILCAVIALSGCYMGFYFYLNGQEVGTTIPTPPGSLQSQHPEKSQNFLIVGTDDHDNTDIIMVLCVDYIHMTANVLQIPRDTYVGNGYPTGKINAVYGNPKKNDTKIGGLIKVINGDFGLPVDHYITMQEDGFRTIVDFVGGVDVYFNDRYNIKDFTNPKSPGWMLGSGMVHLNGVQAEGFIRFRAGLTEGDMGRVANDRNLYGAILEKLMSMGRARMMQLVNLCSDVMQSDMTKGDFTDFANTCIGFQGQHPRQIYIWAVPGESPAKYVTTPESPYTPLSYYSIHLLEYCDLLNTHFLPYNTMTITPSDLKIKELIEPTGPSQIPPGGMLQSMNQAPATTTAAK